MTKKLEVSDLVFDYENRKILNHLDFSVNEGEFVSILGPSGCGKSTLLKLLTGVLKAEKGHILVDGQEIKALQSILPICHRMTFYSPGRPF